jgi:hypothetical protein
MQWGLAQTTGWTIDPLIPDLPHLVHILVERDLVQHVQDAAGAHGATVAAWLRHAMRHVSLEDFPPSWRAGETTARSHEIIRQFIAQATSEDFPSSWQIIPHARLTGEAQPDDDGLAGRAPLEGGR